MKQNVRIEAVIPNPQNPRSISAEKYRQLVRSIMEFPAMLEARPIVVDDTFTVLGGNMRLRAAREAGLEQVPVYVVDWTEKQKREFLIKDNVSFGEWDWDLLANDWEALDLQEWGLDVWTPEENEREEQEKQTCDQCGRQL
jgi:ParB-like chromosome segregation protein Spo0J